MRSPHASVAMASDHNAYTVPLNLPNTKQKTTIYTTNKQSIKSFYMNNKQDKLGTGYSISVY